MVAEISKCSLPTIKLSDPVDACGLAAGDSAGVGVGVGVCCAVFSRGGPLSCWLCTYRVLITKNCPLELTISFITFRAGPEAALNVISTTLRFTRFGGASAAAAPRAGL